MVRKELGKLLPFSRSIKLPTFMRMSEDEFRKVYPYWLIWQAMDRKPSEFLLAMKMPSALLDNFMELDDVFEKLSRINAERIAAEEEEIRKRTGNTR